MSAVMPIAPRPTADDVLAPCYGVMCPMHRDCQRYRDVEAMPAAVVVYGTCVTAERKRLGFVLAAEAVAA